MPKENFREPTGRKSCLLVASMIVIAGLVHVGSKTAEAQDPPLHVWVDDNLLVENETHFKTIRNAEEKVASGGWIYVYEGDYPERVNITKDVTLLGLNGTDVTVVGTSTPSKAGATFMIDPSLNVTITGFKIIGRWSGDFSGIYGDAGTRLIATDNMLVDLLFGIQIVEGYLYADSNEFKVDLTDYAGARQPRAIFLNGGSTDSIIVNNTFQYERFGLPVRIHKTAIQLVANNTFSQGVEGSSPGYGDYSGNIGLSNMGLTTGYTVVRNNTITNGYWGVMSEGTNATVENNTFTGCRRCISSAVYSDPDKPELAYPSNLAVANNTITFVEFGLQVASNWSYMVAYNNNVTGLDTAYGVGANVNQGGRLDLGPNNSISNTNLGVKTYSETFTNASGNLIFNTGEGFHSEGSDYIHHNDFQSNDEGIRVQGNPKYGNRNISNNTIEGSSVRAGIWIFSSTNSDQIQNNEISQGYRGIWLWDNTQNKLIRWNIISENHYGIHFESYGSQSPSSNTVKENNISLNEHGIYVFDSNSNTIRNNNISANRNSGIYLDRTYMATIADSNISNNFMGIVLEGETPGYNPVITIEDNSILGNTLWAINSSLPFTIDAMNNFFGAWNSNSIGEMISGSVNYNPWLEYRESNVDIIDSMSIPSVMYPSPYYVERGMIVNGTLMIGPTADIIFNNSLGQNFIQVNGNMNAVMDSTFSSNFGNYTIIYLNGSSGSISQSAFEGQMGVSIQSSGISVSNSEFANGMAGIIINQGESNTISHSEISTNRHNGTYLYSSSWNNLTDNEIIDNEYFGVRLDLSNNTTIEGGNISQSDFSCVYLYHSDFNQVSLVNITNCENAIYSEASTSNTYTSNNISSNDYGIQIVSGSSNTTIQQSNLSNNFVGISVNLSHPSYINNNSILGNVFYAISAPTMTLFPPDANYNYFGTNDSEQIAKLVTSNVDYDYALDYRESNVDYIDNYTQWTSNSTLQRGVIINATGCLDVSGTQQSPIIVSFNNSHGQNFIQVNNVTNINNTIFNGADRPFSLLFLNSTHGRIGNSDFLNFMGIGIQSEEEHLSLNAGIIVHNSSFNSSSYSLVLHGAKNTLVENSTFTTNSHWGTLSHSSSQIDIGPNNNYSSHRRGLVVEESSELNVSGSEFCQNTVSGISFEEFWPTSTLWLVKRYSEYNDVTGNTFLSNGIGILLGNVSRLDNVTENNFTTNMNGVYITGSWFDGKHKVASNEFYSNDQGVKIEETIYNNVSKNSFTSNSIGVHLADATPMVYPFSGITNLIANNSILNANQGEKGIYLDSSEKNFIHNNTVNSTFSGEKGTNTWGIHLEDSSLNIMSWNVVQTNEYGIRLDESSDNNLTFNNMTNNFYNFGVTGTEIEHFPQEINTSNSVNSTKIYYWVDVTNSTIPTDAGYVGLVNSENITVSNLSMKNNYQGVLIANTVDTTVDDVRVNWTYYGLHMVYSNNNTITGNSSEWNSYFGHNRHGMYIYASSSNTIENCTVKYNTLWGIGIFGAVGKDSHWNNISRAKVSNGGYPSFGIYLAYAHYSKISNSSVFKHEYGIHIYGGCHDNIVEFSNVSENTHIGISFHTDSYHNYVYNNSICKNTWRGVRVWYGAYDTTSFHNNFIDNGDRQAEGQTTNNAWDDGYPSGGNYWSDYGGTDLYSGPNQDQPGSDGIGDTPYGIYNDPLIQKDQYPLMNLANAGPQ